MARAVLVVGLAIGAWFAWAWLFPSDEAQIRGVLERIAEGVSGAGAGEGEGGLDRLARLAALQEEFAPDAAIDAGPPFGRVNGRQAIVAAAARVGGAARRVELTFPDVAITVADDRESAEAVVTAQAEYDANAGGRVVDARELDLRFARVDGRWVINGVVLIDTLTRPQ